MEGLPLWLRWERIFLQCWFDIWDGKLPWRREWQATPVALLREFHGQRSLAGYSPWGCKESDMIEHFHFRKKKKITFVQMPKASILYIEFTQMTFVYTCLNLLIPVANDKICCLLNFIFKLSRGKKGKKKSCCLLVESWCCFINYSITYHKQQKFKNLTVDIFPEKVANSLFLRSRILSQDLV